ncbi:MULTISPECIES: TRAP transporter substrate-binding protein [Virgibacillus]|nr:MULTISPECIES: TRAP transporter substrate-binding protein [Virgibacillus]
MMKKIAFNWVIGSLMIVLLLAGCSNGESASSEGDGQEYTIKFAHVVSPSTAKGKAAEKFGELIEKRTDGQIKVEVYPDSQLGSDREIIEQMQSGTVQMNAPFTGVLPTFVKEFEVFDLPFLFENRDHAFKATNGKLGDILGKKLESQGMHLLGFWDGGFKHLTNSIHPIETPKDMNQLKMRVSQSPLLISQFQAVHAGGVSIDFSELYTALQTGTVDGQENPLSNIVSKKFYEVQDYLTLSSHGYMAYPLVISSKFYQKLPEELQAAVDEVSKEVTEWQWEESKRDEEAYLKKLNKTDIQINELSPEQKAAFKDAMSSVYNEFNKLDGSKELLNAVDQ